MRLDTITMTMHQLDRLKVLQALADGRCNTIRFPPRLATSPQRASPASERRLATLKGQ